MIVRQSTAVTIEIGPALDSTGVEYTGLVIGDLTITKNGSSAAMATAATLTHVSNGHYDLALTTGNTDTVGQTSIRCNKSTYQIPEVRMNVVEEAVYDAFFAESAAGYVADAVAEIKAALDTTAMTESYAANGAAPTKEQALFAIHQMLMQFAISGVSYTVKKLDNSTAAFVVTLDSATTPTSAART